MKIEESQKNTNPIDEKILKEIKDILRKIQPDKVIVFGSYAKGEVHRDSDIDLVIVLNKTGLSSNYRELLKNRMEINRLLREIRSKIPMDILVYTKDEWKLLLKSGGSFFKEINRTGFRIL